MASADVPYTTTRIPADMAYYTSTLPHQRPHHPLMVGQNGGGPSGIGNGVPDAPTRQRHPSRNDPRSTSGERKKSSGGGNQQSNVVTSTLDRLVIYCDIPVHFLTTYKMHMLRALNDSDFHLQVWSERTK